MKNDKGSRKEGSTNGDRARLEGHLGFEATFSATADKSYGDPDGAEYNGGRSPALLLGLLFVKFIISDAFTVKHGVLQKERGR